MYIDVPNHVSYAPEVNEVAWNERAMGTASARDLIVSFVIHRVRMAAATPMTERTFERGRSCGRPQNRE